MRALIHRAVAAAALAAAALAAVAACSGSRATLAPADVPSAERGLSWGPAPAVFPPGAEIAVVQGNPFGNEPFVVRLRFPDGYRIAAHTHPTDEHVTVLAGTFRVGMGTRFREDSLVSLSPGASVTAPAEHPHYAAARGRTVVQVSARGPFALTYVNPDDLPAAARGAQH